MQSTANVTCQLPVVKCGFVTGFICIKVPSISEPKAKYCVYISGAVGGVFALKKMKVNKHGSILVT